MSRGDSNYVFDGETVFNELTEKVTKRLADNYNEMMYKVYNDKYNKFEEDIKSRQDKANQILTDNYNTFLEAELFKNVKSDGLAQTKFYIISESHTLESKLYSSWTHYYYLKLNSNNKIFRLTFQVTPRDKVDCKILVDIREGNSYNRIFTEQYNDFYEGVECDLFENVDRRNHLYLIELVNNLELI